MTQLKNLQPTIRLAIANPKTKSESEFGRGVANLCMGVREKGSLNAAAKSMGMAYSKAWRIMKATEESLGITLLDRDGAHGSTLTPEGNALLDAYFDVSAKVQEFAASYYQEYLGE